MANIHEVARKAGVSLATVSRSFRTPELLSEETRLRVLNAARELNYKPRPTIAEKTLKISENKNGREAIGFQFFWTRGADAAPMSAHYASLLAGAQQEASSAGFHFLIHRTDAQSLANDVPKMVAQRAVDGMLLVGDTGNQAALDLFSRYVPHIVLLDNRDPNRQFECVVSDGFGGMYKATQFLLELGHTRIGFFLAANEALAYRDRLHGYASALLDAGFTPAPELIIGADPADSFSARETHLTNLLAGKQRPTALIVANDDHALYLMRTMRRMGLRTPDDISLIGFNDAAFSLHSDPPLTTVKVDLESMGRLAVQRLVSRIRAPAESVHYPVINKVDVSLVIRQSCRPL